MRYLSLVLGGLQVILPTVAWAQTGVVGQVQQPGRPAAPLAQPYRLRADAVGQARSPTGVLMLQGNADPAEWVRIETLIWAGADEFDEEADALLARLSLRTPDHRAELHLGRMIVGPGAIRPVHLDGVSGVARLPWHMAVEVFGGFPVPVSFEDRDDDWAVGGRLAQSIPQVATLGVAYLHRRSGSQIDDQEVGSDLSIYLGDSVSLVTRAAWDIDTPGFSEALATLSYRANYAWRFEVYGAHRSPSRILPATSLFSVLGDVPAQSVSGRVRWRAAPRLDVTADGGVRTFDGRLGETARVRAVLRLDPVGASVISVEVNRKGGPETVALTGARATFRWRLAAAWLLSSEVELIRPDNSDDATAGVPVLQTLDGLTGAPSRGELWPWALLALEFQPSPEWVMAAAIEGSATSEYERALDGLFRLTWLWGGGNP